MNSKIKHNWTKPLDLVGGIAENPGIFGSGGSIVSYSVCSLTGDERKVDYWDHQNNRPARSPKVTYVRGKYAAQVKARNQ